MPRKDLPPHWMPNFIAPMLLVAIIVCFPLIMLMTIPNMVEASDHPVFFAAYALLLSIPFIFFPPLFYYGLVNYGAAFGIFPMPNLMEEHGDAALEHLAALLVQDLGDARRVRPGWFERLAFTDEVILQFADDPAARLYLSRYRTDRGVNITLTRGAKGRLADVDRIMRPITGQWRSDRADVGAGRRPG